MIFTVAYNLDMRTEDIGWIFQNNNEDRNLITVECEANNPADAIQVAISKLVAEWKDYGAIITKNLNNTIEFEFCNMMYRASNFRALCLI